MAVKIRIERGFADGGYRGAATAAAVRELGAWHLKIIHPIRKNSPGRSLCHIQ